MKLKGTNCYYCYTPLYNKPVSKKAKNGGDTIITCKECKKRRDGQKMVQLIKRI